MFLKNLLRAPCLLEKQSTDHWDHFVPRLSILGKLSILSVEVRLTMQGFSLVSVENQSVTDQYVVIHTDIMVQWCYVKLIMKYNLARSVVVHHQLKPLLVITEGRWGGWDDGNWGNKLSGLTGWMDRYLSNIKPEWR